MYAQRSGYPALGVCWGSEIEVLVLRFDFARHVGGAMPNLASGAPSFRRVLIGQGARKEM